MNFELIDRNFKHGLWSAQMVKKALEKGVITASEYDAILAQKVQTANHQDA